MDICRTKPTYATNMNDTKGAEWREKGINLDTVEFIGTKHYLET